MINNIDPFDQASHALIDDNREIPRPNFTSLGLGYATDSFEFRPVASTPSKRPRPVFPVPFSRTFPELIETNERLETHPIPRSAINHFNFSRAYQTPAGDTYSTIKKYNDRGEADACLLMLWSDLYRNSDEVAPIPEHFWGNIGNNQSGYRDLENIGRILGFEFKLSGPLDSENPFPALQRALEDSGCSIIVSYNPPKISSGWIVLDAIDFEHETLYFRSPHTGKGHSVSFEESKTWFDSENAFYLTRS